MLKRIGKTLLWLGAAMVLTAAGGLGYRAWRQAGAERLVAIATPNGIDEGLFVAVRGTEQWVTIRGQDRANPLLFVLHGGPGATLSPLPAEFLLYERDWTVVQWDQPGAGRTFMRAGGKLAPDTTVAGIAADGLVVAEFVAARLGQPRVVVLGLSFGSVVGLDMVRARPELFSAYVGTGLFVHRDDGYKIVYDRALARARQSNNTDASAALEAIGPPPYTTPEAARTQARWTRELSTATTTSAFERLGELLLAPRQTLADVRGYVGGFVASDEQFDLGAMDLRTSPREFAVPIVIVQGAEDVDTPIELARAYLDSIAAPYKLLVPLERGGHTALVDDAEAFARALNEHVLPLARAAPPAATASSLRSYEP